MKYRQTFYTTFFSVFSLLTTNYTSPMSHFVGLRLGKKIPYSGHAPTVEC